MIVRTLTVALCCCFLAGCGGGGDDTNAATARSFTYGAAQVTTPPQAAGDAFSSLTAFQSTGDEASAVAAHGSLMAVGFEFHEVMSGTYTPRSTQGTTEMLLKLAERILSRNGCRSPRDTR